MVVELNIDSIYLVKQSSIIGLNSAREEKDWPKQPIGHFHCNLVSSEL